MLYLYVTHVNSSQITILQGVCGSCYAFSATGTLEAQYKLRYGELVSFSEQQVVDCSSGYGNWDCSGGWMVYVFNYWRKYGAELSKNYPYSGEVCTFISIHSSNTYHITECTRAAVRRLDLLKP